MRPVKTLCLAILLIGCPAGKFLAQTIEKSSKKIATPTSSPKGFKRPFLDPQEPKKILAQFTGLDEIVYPLGDLTEVDVAREKLCRKLTGYQGVMEACNIHALGGGGAVLLSIVTECGGDSCDVRGFLFRGSNSDPTVLGQVGGGLETSADARTLVYDSISMNGELSLHRRDLDTDKTSIIAACVSPKLSSGGQYFLCRNRVADVLKVPVGGGRLEVVAESGKAAADVEWMPHAYVYPEPVQFPNPRELTFTVNLRNDEVLKKSVVWLEIPAMKSGAKVFPRQKADSESKTGRKEN